ncbi:MAG: glycosyltransferase [Variovorax sp.]|nr:glycosyltransferase [Variovorax sp.]
MPEFSVVIPCYKQAHLLPVAIESVFRQGRDAEVIVVDDGSPDAHAALEVASRYPGVTGIRQANAGVSAARNTGILRASGRFMLFLDADDYLRPGMLETAARAFAEDDELDVVHGFADVVDLGSDKVLGEFGGVDLTADPFHTLLRCNIGPPHTFVLRREVLARVGLFDASLRACEDWDFWLRVAASGAKFRLVREMRSVYSVTPGSLSKNLELMWRTGRVVLGRSGRQHANCRPCREAHQAGMVTFARSMRPLLRDMVRSPGGKRRAAGVLLRNPDLLVWQLRRVLRIDR